MVLSERHFETDNTPLICKWRGSNIDDRLLQAMDKLAPEITIHVWGQPGESDIIHYFDPPTAGKEDEMPDGALLTPNLRAWETFDHEECDYYRNRLQSAGKIVEIGLSLHPLLKEVENKSYIIPPGSDHISSNHLHVDLPGNRPFKIVLNGDCDEAFVNVKAPDNVDLIVMNCPDVEKDQVKNVSVKTLEEKLNVLFTADAVVVGKEDRNDGELLFQAMASKSVVICPFDRKYGGTPNNRCALDSSRNIEQALYAFAGLSYDDRECMIKECESVMADYTWSHTAHCLRLIYHIVSGNK